MIFWAIVAGALIGLSSSGFSGFGLVVGGMAGAIMGAWLRLVMRDELAIALRRELNSHVQAMPVNAIVSARP